MVDAGLGAAVCIDGLTPAVGTVRIVEIYRDKEAYAAHIASAHFRRYKSGTLHMVEELRLLDHTPLASGLAVEVFRRFGGR